MNKLGEILLSRLSFRISTVWRFEKIFDGVLKRIWKKLKEMLGKILILSKI